MNRLLPCPFCGTKDTGDEIGPDFEQEGNNYFYYVECTFCETRGPVVCVNNPTANQSVAAFAEVRRLWNERG